MFWLAPVFLAALAAGPQAPAMSQEVVVYFDRDAANMKNAALDIIDSRLRGIQLGSGAVRVEGHTSTLGDAAYNVGLSERRATAVRNALMARGVLQSRITAVAMGESAPARPTEDGVDEPLNDRVVIRLQ
jgi:OOP family OmpA-OmpF porin